MADKPSTVEQLEEKYGKADYSGPFERAGKNWAGSMKQRGQDIKDTVGDPSLGVLEKAAVTGSNVLGMAADTAFTPFGAVLDAAVPGTPMEALGEAAMKTEAGQHVSKFWDNLSDEDKVRVRAGAMPLEVVAARLGFGPAIRATARNAPALVPDFYSGNPVRKAAGVFNAFANRGTGDAVRQAVTPAGQALLREGVPQGLVTEIDSLTNALRLYDTVIQKKKDGTPLDKRESDAYKMITDAGTLGRPSKKALANMTARERKEALGKQPATKGKLRTFIEGTLMTRINLLKQEGKDTGVLETLIENPMASNVSRFDSPAVREALGTLPEPVTNRLMSHVRAVHKLNDDDIILNRSGVNDVTLSNEAYGKLGTPHGRIQQAFRRDDKKVGELAKAGIDKFESPEEFKLFVEASNLPPKDQAKLVQLSRVKDSLTKPQQKVYTKIMGDLTEAGRVRVSEPDADGFMYFQSAFNSEAKELGGVNAFSAANPKTGEIYVVLNDGSDLVNKKAPGMRSLVTIVDPVKWDMYEPKRKGTSSKTGTPPKSTKAEAIAQTAERTGVQPDPKMGLTDYATKVVEEYRPKPQARDYVSAAGNVAKLGTAAGLMTPNNYVEQ